MNAQNGDRPSSEIRIARLRSQLAVVRAVADHVEHFIRATDADGLSPQLQEEMARLGRRLLDVATDDCRVSLEPVFESREPAILESYVRLARARP